MQKIVNLILRVWRRSLKLVAITGGVGSVLAGKKMGYQVLLEKSA